MSTPPQLTHWQDTPPVSGANGHQSEQGNPEETLESWFDSLMKSIKSSPEFQALEIQPRPLILGEWLKEGDLGFIFAARGVGKTWFAMDLAHAITEGRYMGPWNNHEILTCLYVDGEMPPEDIKQRDFGLSTVVPTSPNLLYVNHEILFRVTGRVMNLADRELQLAILKLCVDKGLKVLFLDNLSTLAPAGKENDGDDWGVLLPWLLELRRHKITVIFIHHAGRNGMLRGHSRKEDTCSWIIRLDLKSCPVQKPEGAVFISSFTKNRNAQKEPEPIEWHYEPDGNKTRVTYKEASKLDVFRQQVEEGLDSATDIAEEMGISKGYASKLAKKAVDQGWLRISQKGKYEIVAPWDQ